MKRAWLIAKKDMKEGFGQRALLLRMVLPSVLLAIGYGVLTGSMLAKHQQRPEEAAIAGRMITLFGATVALMGTMAGSMIAAQAIALERSKNTIESLLATPVTDREILVGKMLAGYIPAVIGGYGTGGLYYVAARIFAGMDPLVLPAAFLGARFMLAVLPLVTGVGVAAGVVVSSRCGTVTGAIQVSNLATLPVFAGVLLVSYKLSTWPHWAPIAAAAGLAALMVLLLRVGEMILGREEIVARLD